MKKKIFYYVKEEPSKINTNQALDLFSKSPEYNIPLLSLSLFKKGCKS